jgi:hypothetical protein
LLPQHEEEEQQEEDDKDTHAATPLEGGEGAYTEEKEGRLCKIAVEEVVEGEHAILGLVELLEQLLGCRGVVAHRGRV